MSVSNTRLANLPAHERAEIEEILAVAIAARPRVTARFASDEGDTMAWYLLVFVAVLAGLVAIVVDRAACTEPSPWFTNADFPGLLLGLSLPGLLAIVAILVAILVGIAVKFLRVHKRHGWMATTFGVVRLRGHDVRLLRYADVASAVRRHFRAGRGFFVLELVATDGTRMTLYTGSLMNLIQSRLPPTAVNERE